LLESTATKVWSKKLAKNSFLLRQNVLVRRKEMNFWLALGFFAQLLFSLRFLVQWLVSEKQKRSVMPVHFWYLSISGSGLLLVYAIHRNDPVFILGQSVGLLIYIRNLMLIRSSRNEPNFPKSDY
jgi:lipid-A-disaccharide synthase-like uncharacterized protein